MIADESEKRVSITPLPEKPAAKPKRKRGRPKKASTKKDLDAAIKSTMQSEVRLGPKGTRVTEKKMRALNANRDKLIKKRKQLRQQKEDMTREATRLGLDMLKSRNSAKSHIDDSKTDSLQTGPVAPAEKIRDFDPRDMMQQMRGMLDEELNRRFPPHKKSDQAQRGEKPFPLTQTHPKPSTFTEHPSRQAGVENTTRPVHPKPVRGTFSF